MRAQGRRGGAHGRVGLELESGSVGGRETVPTRGARLAAKQGGEVGAGPDWTRGGERAGGEERRGAGWAETKENGPRKRRKEEKEKVGRAERSEGKKKAFSFSETIQHFQFKFKLKDLNLS